MGSGVSRLHALGQPWHQMGGDAFRRAPVPEFRNASALSNTGEDLLDTLRDERLVPSYQDIGALLDRDRSLGVLAHRQARDTERGRLFLDSARIGDDQRCVLE